MYDEIGTDRYTERQRENRQRQTVKRRQKMVSQLGMQDEIGTDKQIERQADSEKEKENDFTAWYVG